MIQTNGDKPCVAVSYDSLTYNDLIYFSQHPIGRITPEEFFKNPTDANQYINLITIDLQLRKQITKLLDKHNLSRFSYVHHTTILSNSHVESGTFIYPGCILYPETTINNDVLIHSNTVLVHGSTVGTGTIIAAGVGIAGSSTIGKHCFLGINSTIVDKINVCDDVVLGANSLIVKNIETPGTYVGNPCRLTK